ncbi:hypothetical protein PS2_002199 [Malus domestica]
MGSWKIVEEDHIDVSLVGSRRGGCFLNGALHWNQIDGSNKATKIWSFDFAQEKFRSFSFIRRKGYTTAAGLGTIGNRLFFYTSCNNLTNHHDLEDAGLTIWVMMKYGVDQCWTIFAKIRAEIFPSDVKWEDEEEEDTCKIVLNNPGIEGIPAMYLKAVIYVETLISPVTGNA